MLVLSGHTAPVTALAYFPDGSLASGGRDGHVRLWDSLSGQSLLACRTEQAFPIGSVAAHPGRRLVAAGTLDGEAWVWATRDGRLHRRRALQRGARHPAFVAFTADGERLLTALHHNICEWPVDGEQHLRTLTLPTYWSAHPITSLACAADGRMAAGYRNAVAAWPGEAGGVPSTLHWPGGDVVGLDFARAGTLLAIARGRQVGLWEERRPGTNHFYRLRHFPHTDTVRVCAFTPDGRVLLTGGDDWTVHLWDVDSGQKQGSHNWRLGPLLALAVAPDGMTAAVSGRERPEVVIWDLE